MAWRYCSNCGAGQDRITIEEVENASWSETGKVECEHCGAERDDDSMNERMALLASEIIKLRQIQTIA